MIETPGAVANLDEILEVPGIDAIFVGPNDLAVAAGLQPANASEEPEHARLVDTVLQACRRRGIVPGIYCGGAEVAVARRRQGFQMLALQSDAVLLRQASIDMVARLRGEPVGTTPEGTYA
jgi:4-hydroxy-2-oxoheptanedioate aldolase